MAAGEPGRLVPQAWEILLFIYNPDDMNLKLRPSFAQLVKCVLAVPGRWFTSRYALFVLLLCCTLSGMSQILPDTTIKLPVKPVENTKVKTLEGKIVEPNFSSFPTRDIMSPELWAKANPGKPYSAAKTARYQSFGDDTVMYAEVVDKRTPFENYYINPTKPSEFTLEKAIYPVNFKRNGQWIPIDPNLRPMGNGLYEAPDQWDPVGIQTKDRITYIRIAGQKVQFNNWTLYGVNGNDKTPLATANWSHYTIGADGMRIINIFPGIDAEMRVGRGVIKTSFIIHEYKFAQYEELYFEDAFAGASEKGLYFKDNDNTRKRAETVYADVAGKTGAMKIAPAFGYVKNNYSVTTTFPYDITGNNLSIAVPYDYIINNLPLGDVVIDPVVESENSISQTLVNTGHDGTCNFSSYCGYTISVTPPANSTITRIGARVHVVATAPCGLENFAFMLFSGACYSPAPGYAYTTGATGPGEIWNAYYAHDALLPCMPAPSCTPAPVDFNFWLFRSCAGPIGCDNSCLGLANPLSVRIRGNTAELTPVVINPASICPGGNIEFSTSTQNGVPPFSNIDWSFDNSFTSIVATGPSITIPNTFAPGTYPIYVQATDACGTVATGTTNFTVNPLPVITLAAGETICTDATTNITPVSSVAGTTYSWTVTQTGVAGASDGTGTSINQTLTNTGTTPGTAVYTITPLANGCAGTPVTYTVTVQPVNNVLYVDALNGDDANCGDSWTTSLKTLSAALEKARHYAIVDSILVAQGTYYPTGSQSGTDRNTAFLITRGKLKLFGGYPNGGGARDIASHPTVLSGDIGAVNDSLDNSYHVMVIVDIPAAADSIVIDGFNFTKGNANGTGTIPFGTQGIYQGHGAGIYMSYNENGQKTALRNLTITDGTAGTLGGGVELVHSSPFIQNCEFRNNRAYGYGGALANDHAASPFVTDCRFINNIAHTYGGAVFTQEAVSRPVFTNCRFTGNRCVAIPSGSAYTFGGALYSHQAADVTVANCIFSNNSTTSGGGAICNGSNVVLNISNSVFENNVSVTPDGNIGTGGAVQLQSGTTNIMHSVFINNRAGGTIDDGGGAVMVYGGTASFTNVTLLNNTTQSSARPNGNGISILSGACSFNNSIAWGAVAQVHNQATFNNNHSLVKGTAAALPNLDIDPQFVNAGNPVGADGIWGTADDGLQLTPCSPAANMGNNAHVTEPLDIAGGARIFDNTVDMGAYELQSPVTPLTFTDIVKTYGDADAAVPNFTSCSGLPVTFTVADNTIATATNGNLQILNAGVTTITAHIPNGTPDVMVNLTVNPRPVTVSLIPQVAKVYDGNVNAVISAANLELAAGDVVGADDVTIVVNNTAALYDTKEVGTGKTVTVPLANIGLTGASAANYVIGNSTGISAAIGIITPLAVTVTADAQSKEYGDSDPVLTYTVTPALMAGDAFTGSLQRAPGEDAGVYAINQGTVALNGNYTITYTGNNLTITPKTITINADAQAKVYGDSDPALTYTYSPALVGSDAFTGTLARVAGENIGVYAINQGTLALSPNYTMVYNGANLTISPKTITVTADAQLKVYGDADPPLTYTYSPALFGTDGFTGVLARNAGENVGDYTINQGTLALSPNYTVVYNGADLTIVAKTITVAADAKLKTYGDPDPVLTYTYTPALLGADVFTGALSRMAGENAGTYAINQGTLALNNNYQLVYNGANLVIDKAVLTVTAANETICLNDVLTTVPVTYAGFRNGDDALSLMARPVVPVPSYNAPGNYTLTPEGGVSSNYTFNYVDGQLTVLPVPAGSILQMPVGSGIVNTAGVPTGGIQLHAPAGAGYAYTWSTGEATQSITVNANADYYVVVTDPSGCSARFTTRVVQQTLIIPNIFSPNGDGIHDKWVIENLQNFPGNVVQVYNRYGQLVFKMTNYTPWDGRVNGKDMPVGTYYYIIDRKNGQKPVTGYIDIIR